MRGSIRFFGTDFIISVSVMPGATALTLIPFGPSSLAREIVKPFTANFDVGYAIPQGWPEMLTIEDVERITPLPCSTIISATALDALKTPFTFRFISLSNSSSV